MALGSRLIGERQTAFRPRRQRLRVEAVAGHIGSGGSSQRSAKRLVDRFVEFASHLLHTPYH
jgi:hypothetical protein